jgi:hypothetical protein
MGSFRFNYAPNCFSLESSFSYLGAYNVPVILVTAENNRRTAVQANQCKK